MRPTFSFAPSMEAKLFALVLAGGRSARMGTDKRFLEFDGERFLDRAVRVAREAIGAESAKVFVAGSFSGPICGGRKLRDPIPGLGPIGGLLGAARSIGVGPAFDVSPRLLVLPVDMPLVPVAVLQDFLREAGRLGDCSAIAYEGFELPILLRLDPATRGVIEELAREQRPGARSIRGLLERLEAQRLSVPQFVATFMVNVNYREDWQALKERGAS